ncbi:MAG TPA: hypothetical protein VMG12_03990 [Polyangiaceae bacterium]|nr:hypothetical protein [Polyangiaceae bacterium]
MTDSSDVLARAARALREAHPGEREGSGFTRARIMNTVHRERRRRTLRWAVFSPIASVLLVGSAWAQSSGKWPVIWEAVTSVFVAAPEPPAAPSSQRSAPRENGSPRAELAPPSSALADAGDDSDEAPPVLELADPEPPRVAPEPRAPQPVRPRRHRRTETPTSVERERAEREAPPAPEPQPDRELSRFRRAHDLHFKGRAGEAIDAYADYLREFPDGRFVPEARYAMALDHIKQGNDAAAREALASFAAGRYGGYRQEEARKLLDALEKKLDKKQPRSP